MQFRIEIIVNKPIKEVWDYFDDEKNLSKWVQHLTKFEHVSGEKGQPGAVSHHHYEENGKSFMLVETISERVPYEKFEGTMSHKTMDSFLSNRFIDLRDNRTSITCDIDVKFNTIIFKIMGPFMKGMMMKRMKGDFDRFKECVEQGK